MFLMGDLYCLDIVLGFLICHVGYAGLSKELKRKFVSKSRAFMAVLVVLDVVPKLIKHHACPRFGTEVRKCFDVGLT